MAPSAFAATMSPISPLLVRNIVGDANGVRTTFSSWDNCMQKDYCKWPVIAVIVIGSLIVLSILFCVVRCCCCGMECCCAACSCINACCPSPRGGKDRTKYRDAAPPPPHGYQPTPAPFYGGPTVPQFATFDASKKVNGDSLPAMPSWDTATSKKVVDETQPEEVEMDKMDQHDETKPMLAHGASPQIGGTAYGQTTGTVYADGMGQPAGAYGQNEYRGQTATAGGALAAGALASRQQAGSAQGYRNANGQRPGMPPSQDSYASNASGMQGYGQGRPQQNFGAAGAYGQQRSQGYGNGQQHYNDTGYGQSNPSTYDRGYGGDRSPTYNQGGYDGGHSYQRQEYDSHNFAPSQAQSFGHGPSPPQPTYGGAQEYTRPAAQIPSSLAPGSRGNPYANQQSYQPYQGAQHQSQSGWRDV